MIHRRYREIPLFVAGLVTEVWILLFSGVPYAGLGIDVVKAVVDALVESDVVENEKLRLWTEVDGVADACGLEIFLSLLRNVTRITRISLAGDRIFDIADDVQRLHLGERIQEGGIRIGDQEHVALLDLLKAADAGTVEAQALIEDVLRQFARGN